VIEACEDADIVVTEADEAIDDVDAVLADRPIASTAPVIVLASGRRRSSLRATWPADVRAVVPADIDAATLGSVIAVVAAGLVVMPHEDIAGEESAGVWTDPIDGADQLSIVLTPREREVLALLAEGASNKDIARALAVSVHTAKFHVASLTEKLGAHGRLEAITIAIRAGLVMV